MIEVRPRRKVYHRNQKVVEYYEHSRNFGWIGVSADVGDEWSSSSFEYVELIHDAPMGKNGMYGHHITF